MEGGAEIARDRARIARERTWKARDKWHNCEIPDLFNTLEVYKNATSLGKLYNLATPRF